jgi:hypothetical protein
MQMTEKYKITELEVMNRTPINSVPHSGRATFGDGKVYEWVATLHGVKLVGHRGSGLAKQRFQVFETRRIEAVRTALKERYA